MSERDADFGPGVRVEATEECYTGGGDLETLEPGSRGELQTKPRNLPPEFEVIRWDVRPDVPCTVYARKIRVLTDEAKQRVTEEFDRMEEVSRKRKRRPR